MRTNISERICVGLGASLIAFALVTGFISMIATPLLPPLAIIAAGCIGIGFFVYTTSG